MKTECQNRGYQAEQHVATMLKNKGFIILGLNFRKKCGEIDIIAENRDLIVFVEVKQRCSQRVDLGELVNIHKQRKIGKTALNYIAESGIEDKLYRFDVALVISQGPEQKITYIENAFQIDGGF